MTIPSIGSLLSNEAAMDLAIQLAYLGANKVSPNPPVGCVVLDKSYKLLSYGYHEYFGGPHAEVNALQKLAKADLEGAHVFVTLEPCSIHRKTPACADFLSTLPVESVTYAITDPNPDVSGRGAKLLNEKNIRANLFTYKKDEIDDLLLSFSHHLQKKEAFIALKVAASMDGAIADHNKKSQWITSEESRSHTHFLRSRYHAILVGKNTIIEDNPSLNVRHAMFPEHRNKVLILNTDLDVLPSIVERKVYKLRKPEDIIFISSLSSAKSLEPVGEHLFRDTKTGVLVLPLEETKLGLNLQQLKSLLPKIGIYDVMVEGGAVTYSSFIEQNAFDHIYLFQAPILLGGEESMLWTSNFSKTIDDKVDLKIMSTKRLGVDILVQLSKK